MRRNQTLEDCAEQLAREAEVQPDPAPALCCANRWHLPAPLWWDWRRDAWRCLACGRIAEPVET